MRKRRRRKKERRNKDIDTTLYKAELMTEKDKQWSRQLVICETGVFWVLSKSHGDRDEKKQFVVRDKWLCLKSRKRHLKDMYNIPTTLWKNLSEFNLYSPSEKSRMLTTQYNRLIVKCKTEGIALTDTNKDDACLVKQVKRKSIENSGSSK